MAFVCSIILFTKSCDISVVTPLHIPGLEKHDVLIFAP